MNTTPVLELPDPANPPTVTIAWGAQAPAVLPDPADPPVVTIESDSAVTLFPQESMISIDGPGGCVQLVLPATVVDLPIGVGVPGAQGPQGPPGPSGGGGIAPIVFSQPTQSGFWHIVHGQGYDPNVVVQRSDGVTLAGFGSIYSLDRNTVDLYFGVPTSGFATLNF